MSKTTNTATSRGLMNKFFKLDQNNTSVKVEVIAGITTFATMAYVLALIPSLMETAGMPKAASLTAVIVTTALSCIAMGLYSNTPFVLAPGLGSAALLAVTICVQQGVPWQVAIGMVVISGIAFVLLTVTGIRKYVVDAIPASIKIAMGAGIGLSIVLLGLKDVGIIAANPSNNLLSWGALSTNVAAMAVVGLLISVALVALKVKGGMLIGILLTTVIGLFVGVTTLPSSVISVPTSMAEVSFKAQPLAALSLKYFPFMFAFFMSDFFSTIGCIMGVAAKAGFLDKDGNMPGIGKNLLVDSVATVVCAFFGVPVMTTYLESAAGVEAGGRTGLTSVTTGIAFLCTLFITPIALMIPSAAILLLHLYLNITTESICTCAP